MKNLIVPLFVCIACAVIVSFTAVSVRYEQKLNQENEKKEKILAAAGIQNSNIDEEFSKIKTLFFSFETGELVLVESGYDHIKAASNVQLSNIVPSKLDIAIIKRQEKIAPLYVWLDEASKIEKIVLPIRGYGLWGTLYGYLSLGPDLNSVMGIEYYEHKETPGLGGEVDNPNWKSGWEGKRIYNSEGSVSLKVVKGVSRDDYEIDGMSGATITSNGVTNMINFWLGDQGYGPIIKKLNEVIE